MRELFENLSLDFYLPKLNYIQRILKDIDQSATQNNAHSSVKHFNGLCNLSENCNFQLYFLYKFQ